MASIGVNLTSVSYYATEFPFIDRFKSSGNWWLGGAQPDALKLDANGYPTGMPNGANYMATMVNLDPVTAGTDHRYVLTWDGDAWLNTGAYASVVSRESNKVVFDYNGTEPTTWISIDAMNGPVTNIHIVREDQVDLFKAGEIFNPTFIDRVDDLSMLRFMDWQSTNGSTLAHWADRLTPDSASWGVNKSGDSVPIEIMTALANKAHTDMWISIPAMADDDFVRHTLAYVRDNLADGLKVHVEYSNEVWNWSFDQSRYAMDQGRALFGHDFNGDGRYDGPGEGVPGDWLIYYGYRSAQIASIAKDVFGGEADQRVAPVISTQTWYPGIEYYVFDGIARAGLGTAGDLFKEYAVATYFGGELSGYNEADRATVLSWVHGGAAGIDAALHEIEYGGSLSGEGALADMVKYWSYQAGIAQREGMDLVAYEGGLGVVALPFAGSDQPDVVAFLDRLDDDPRMQAIVAKMIDTFEAVGGTALNAYNDAGAPTIFGNWGNLDTIYSDVTPRWAALIAASEKSHPAPVLAGRASVESAPPPPVAVTLMAGATVALVEAGQSGQGIAASSSVLTIGGTDAALDLSGWTATTHSGVYTKAGTYGFATLDVDAHLLSYTLDNDRAATDGLRAGATATDDFSVAATGRVGTASETIHFTITGTNDGPSAIAHDLAGTYGKALTTSAATLLGGATDPDGDVLTIASVGNARHGTVTLDARGNAVFTPFVGYSGTASYDYTVADGNGGTATAQATVAVGGSTPAYINHAGTRVAEIVDFTGDGGRRQFVAGSGDTTIFTGSGGGSFRLGAGESVVIGGTGKDTITFGSGHATVTGGEGGQNGFVLQKGMIAGPSAAGAYDTVTDFHVMRNGWTANGDFIWLSGFSRNATVVYERDIAGQADQHLYKVVDGAYHAEFVLTYAGAGMTLNHAQWGLL